MTKLYIHRESANTHPGFAAELEAAGAEVVLYDDDYVLDDELRAAVDRMTACTDGATADFLD